MLFRNISLKSYNTFGLEVKADLLFEYTSVHELVDFLSVPEYKSIPVFLLGGGSNVLFTKPFQGLILHSKITGFETVYEDKHSVYVRVGAGVEWDDFVAWAVGQNLGGIENLSLIPGHVGATPVQNIGAYGVEAKDVIDVVEAVNIQTGKICKFLNQECGFGYRDSIFKRPLKDKYIVTRVTFRLAKQPVFKLDYGNVLEVLEKKYKEHSLPNIRNTIIEIRESKLPDHREFGNAGSFFKNPVLSEEQFGLLQRLDQSVPNYKTEGGVKVPAAWLIDQCGLKGFNIGGAMVHTNQPLVIINTGQATASDIVQLSEHIQASVLGKFNVTLEPEVNFI